MEIDPKVETVELTQSRRIDILMVSTLSHIPFVWTVVSSISRHCSLPIRLFIVGTDDLPDAPRRTFSESMPHVSLQWLWIKDLDSRLSKVAASQSDIHRISYARLLGPNLLPPDCERVIYLDTDLVVRDDICKLWRRDLQDFPIAAARDLVSPWIGSAKYGIHDYRKLGFDASSPYFNAGVLVIDVLRWKRENVEDRCFDFLETSPVIKLADQDALNAVFYGNWLCLEPAWNLFAFNYGGTYSEVLLGSVGLESIWENPSITHFAGPVKPWSYEPDPVLLPRHADEWRSIIENGPFARDFSRTSILERLEKRIRRNSLVRFIWFVSLSTLVPLLQRSAMKIVARKPRRIRRPKRGSALRLPQRPPSED